MAGLSAAEQALVAAAAVLVTHAWGENERRALSVIEELLPDVPPDPERPVWRVRLAASDLIGAVHAGERMARDNARSRLRMEVGTFFELRMGAAYNRWRAEVGDAGRALAG